MIIVDVESGPLHEKYEFVVEIFMIHQQLCLVRRINKQEWFGN